MNIHSVPVTMPSTTTRVLDAALAVFTERTYGGAAVPQVAARAGVGVGTIYRSFAGKEELVNAVYRRAKQQLARQGLVGEVLRLGSLGGGKHHRSRIATTP